MHEPPPGRGVPAVLFLLNRRQTMLKSTMSRCVLIAGLCCVCDRAARGGGFTNGDFEGGTYSQVFGTSTDTLPSGWTNSPPTAMSNLDVFANGSGPGAAESGTHYVAFQSAERDGTQDCLNQVFDTVPNQQYRISFWVAMTASSGSQFGLNPEWDAGGSNDQTMGANAFYYHPTNSPAVPYTFFSFIETASSTSTSMYFHGADSTGAVLIDNVTVAAVPEPATLGLLGVASVGPLARRRRRHRAFSSMRFARAHSIG